MARLLGIDIGTTGCRAVLIDEQGAVLAASSREHPLYTPQPGWTEQDPADWVRGATESIAEIGESFDGVGFTGQMHGATFLDADDRVIRPALLWNDQRTHAQIQEMQAQCGLATIYEETCNPPLTGFQAGKILWLKREEPEHFARVRSVLLPKDYVRFALTGTRATDASDASGTGLFHVAKRTWSHKLMDALSLNPDYFPNCFESADVVCKWKGAQVVAGAGDQAGAAVGTGAVENRVVSVSLGTSGVVFASQDAPTYDDRGRVHTFCHANGGWHSMGVMLSCGGALRWARDTFGFRDYDEMNRLAANHLDPGIVFKPYLSGERTPHNDPNLRGSLHGLNLSTGREEIAAGVFLGISFGLLDGFEALNKLRNANCESIRVTGGGSRSDYWMQLLADLFGVTTVRLAVDEGPAFGAAILAGVGAGVWESVSDAAKRAVCEVRQFTPSQERHSKLMELRTKWLEY